MLLRTLELKNPAGEGLGVETAAPPGVDCWMGGLMGAISGMLAAMVGGAAGSAFNQSLAWSLTALLMLLMLGCTYSRWEYRKGDMAWAEFLLTMVQAAATAGLGTCLALSLHSLMLLQISLAVGVATPLLMVRLTQKETQS